MKNRMIDGLSRVHYHPRPMPQRAAIFLLFFVSGALGLVYEVLWLRMLILVFGSTQFAVSTILTAFMGGLALGSYLFGRIVDRRTDPVRLYGLLEIGIGLYAIAVPFLFEQLVPVYRFIWNQFEPDFFVFSLLRFLFVLAVLIVPTTLMGGTLPILSKFLVTREESIGLSVGSLYAVNTFGAVAGTALTGFVLIPSWGTSRTIMLAAGLNLVVGLAAFLVWRAGVSPVDSSRLRDTAGPAIPPEARLILWVLGGSGFVAMIYEIVWTRVLALIIGSSVYAFTIMLTTFLVGLAVGAAVVSRIADRLKGRFAIEGMIALLTGTALAAFGTLLLFPELPYQFARIYHDIRGSNTWIFSLKFGMAFAVMLPPTLLLGGLFPLAIRYCAPHVEKLGRSVGMVYASNTLGTILGSFISGFFLIPHIGIQNSLLLAILLDLALAAVLVVGATGALRAMTGWPLRRRVVGAVLLVLLGAGLWFGAPAWNTLVMNSGVYQYADDMEEADLTREGFNRFMIEDIDLKFYKEGMTTSVMVVRERSSGVYLLAVNGKIDASSEGDLPTQLLSGHIPLLMNQDPKEILVIGFASGITVGSAAQHPIEKLTAVEIEPAILDASHFFDPFNHRPLEDPRVRAIRNDGRNYMLVTSDKYDVIISEPSNPWMTVASNLFTREFFELGRTRLKPGGVFGQWLQLYGMSPLDLQSLTATFHSVFPHVLVFNTIEDADLLLIGADHPLTIDMEAMARRMSDLSVKVDLMRLRIATPQDILSYLVFGTNEMDRFTGGAPLNTDDNALIEFHAPKSLHYETRGANTVELMKVLVDPTTYTVGLDDPGQRRAHYLSLADAYRRRSLFSRAREMLSTVPGLAESLEGQELIRKIDSHKRGG